MGIVDLDIIIPSRNEQFLKNTIEDILAHSEGDTRIIAVLDGEWADPPIDDHERVTLIYHPVSIGQRAATRSLSRPALNENSIGSTPYIAINVPTVNGDACSSIA